MVTDSTDAIFPLVWITRMEFKGNMVSPPSEQMRGSMAYTIKYFVQLTSIQIPDLYRMFGYHADDSFVHAFKPELFNKNLKNGNLKRILIIVKKVYI